MSEKGDTGETGATGAEGAAGAAGAEGAVGRTGLQGEAGPASMLDPESAAEIKGGLRFLVIATVVLYIAVLVGGAFVYVDARRNASNNAARITDIQATRVDSCRQTYEGVREVFKPLLPPVADRTERQRKNIATFNKTIDELKTNCAKQTDTQEAR